LMEAPPVERHDILVECVRFEVARVLRMDVNQLPHRKGRLMDLGIDSLMALELRNRINEVLELQYTLPATLVFDYPTAEAIAGFLEREVFGVSEGVMPVPGQMLEELAEEATATERIAHLTDEQIELMLLERLKNPEDELN
jgi:myxalamid-type polyketide synthase MxaC